MALCLALPAAAQDRRADDNPYSRKNTFDIFGEYSNDSSHIILGVAPNRKLAAIGVQYERRLFENRSLRWSYDAEFRPFVVSSDPAATSTYSVTANGVATTYPPGTSVVERCVAGTSTNTLSPPIVLVPETFSNKVTCGRQLTIAQAESPLGFRLTLRPRKSLQVMFSTNAGFMYSTQPIPIPTAGSFNFAFNFGGGLEYFYKPHRSIRLEYLVQHYSNANSANQNPGVDSGFLRVSYAFGR